VESAELLKKLSAYMQGCEDKCIDLRTLTFDAKNGETGLSGKDEFYVFKRNTLKPKDAKTVHAMKQFCKMIKVPFTFQFRSPEYLRKQMVECWLPSLKGEKALVLFKCRRELENSYILRALLPVEFTNVSNVDILDKVFTAAGEDFKIELVLGDEKDDLVLHIRMISNDQFDAYGEQCSLSFMVTASELGAEALRVDTALFLNSSKSYILASYGGDPYFECQYEKIQSKELLDLFPQLITHLKGRIQSIRSKIQSAKELTNVVDAMATTLINLRLRKGIPESFHTTLAQSVQEKPITNMWDLAVRCSTIAKDFELNKRVKIERMIGDLIGLNFANR